MTNIHIIKVLILVLAVAIGPVFTRTYTDVNNLYTTLLTGYNKDIRPETDQYQITSVTASFSIIALQDIDEVKGTVTVSGFFTFSWIDNNLKWDPVAHNEIYSLELPQNAVWKPPVTVRNSVNRIKIMTVDDTHVSVQEYGLVNFYPGDSYTFTCDIDSSKFPFDSQVCTMDILSWGYSNETLAFVPGLLLSDLMATNSEWEVTLSKITADYFGTLKIPGFNIEFHFKRRYFFMVINLLIPVIFLGLLNIFVFVLPQESGERVGFSITALLTVVVYLTIAQEILPATATPRLAALYQFLISDMVMSGSIVMSVIFSSWIYHRSEEKSVPKFIKRILTCCERRSQKLGPESNVIQPADCKEKPKVSLENSTDKSEDKITWAVLSNWFDRVSFIFYLVWFLAGNLKFVIDTQ